MPKLSKPAMGMIAAASLATLITLANDPKKFFTFLILGIITGSIYAIAASGLVVTYTTSGIFNFAHGAIGMVMAFVFWELRYDWGLPTWLSFILVVFVIAPASAR
jgi:branched-subunit amino acid ABC-type transport system permease component